METKTVSGSQLIMAHSVMPQDANPVGIAHGGIVMKHIDDTAGIVAIRHCNGLAVTASIDRIDFYHPVFIGELLVLKASINYAGKTSMEIGVRVEAENSITRKIHHTASAYATFVALDDNFKPKPTRVPGLIYSNQTEIRRGKEAQIRKKLRMDFKNKSGK